MNDVINLDEVQSGVLTDLEGENLLPPVMDSLILNTLKHMKKNKALNPDGFSVEYYLAMLDIVGMHFYLKMRHFF